MILKDIMAFGIVVYVVLSCFELRVGIRYLRSVGELIGAWGDLTPTMRETGGPGF
ncbi:hypothetical protein HFO45_15275 [Rhizobium leguminosarum]|uniref:hypothetical protein n=1 Tax=Rhizobium TaxID=379 RepID=UPI001C9014FF|nr:MULTISPECIES: hypothetical protein [Rhizobium]MBY3120345.1 hypothetical protein [Rhizobium laguerreae]MBY3188692.1 hypothetical protein [Rhizobium laguerreae]MBY5649621.1 hypothetical protein [Rhizobium leguminosarum]